MKFKVGLLLALSLVWSSLANALVCSYDEEGKDVYISKDFGVNLPTVTLDRTLGYGQYFFQTETSGNVKLDISGIGPIDFVGGVGGSNPIENGGNVKKFFITSFKEVGIRIRPNWSTILHSKGVLKFSILNSLGQKLCSTSFNLVYIGDHTLATLHFNGNLNVGAYGELHCGESMCNLGGFTEREENKRRSENSCMLACVRGSELKVNCLSNYDRRQLDGISVKVGNGTFSDLVSPFIVGDECIAVECSYTD